MYSVMNQIMELVFTLNQVIIFQREFYIYSKVRQFSAKLYALHTLVLSKREKVLKDATKCYQMALIIFN